MSIMPLLSIDRLTVKAPSLRLVCQDLSMQILPKQRWVILGENGVGKTSLLHTLSALAPAQKGSIYYKKKRIEALSARQRARHLAFLPQQPTYPAEQSVIDTVLAARYPHHRIWVWRETATDRETAADALTQFNLTELAERRLGALSGGERQRVAISATWAQRSKILLLDEPTTFLDLHHQHHLFRQLSEYCKQEDAAYVVVLQDPNLALRYASHALLLFGDGSWEAGEIHQMLTQENASRLYRHPMQCVSIHDYRTLIAL